LGEDHRKYACPVKAHDLISPVGFPANENRYLTRIIHRQRGGKFGEIGATTDTISRRENRNALIRIDSDQALYKIDGAVSTGRDTTHYRSDGTVVVYHYISVKPSTTEGIREIEEYSLRCSIVNHYYIFEAILYLVKHLPLISDLTKIVDGRCKRGHLRESLVCAEQRIQRVVLRHH